jgi:hypothetical protein
MKVRLFRKGVLKISTSEMRATVIPVTADAWIMTRISHGTFNQEAMRVVNNQSESCRRLWVSYPWIRNEERDFAYLIPQLKAANIEAVYDSFQLPPNSQLGERVVQRLSSIGFDGWLYILTHQCFTRRAYTDELTGAIDQTLLRMGSDFPVAGLMYGIATQQVPPALRVLPCISLGDPDWKRQLSSVFRDDNVPCKREHRKDESRFVWKIHEGFDGDSSMTAIEVRTRGDRIQYWRFAAPKSAKVIRWGLGRSGGREISRVVLAEAKGSARYENRDVTWFGAANTVSDTESAFALFSGPLPDFICFGPSQSPFGSPGNMEAFWPGLQKQQ